MVAKKSADIQALVALRSSEFGWCTFVAAAAATIITAFPVGPVSDKVPCSPTVRSYTEIVPQDHLNDAFACVGGNPIVETREVKAVIIERLSKGVEVHSDIGS
mgnify:CR=1 FL=1